MNATITPREVPAGKILLAEYGELDDTNTARVTLMGTAFSTRVRADVSLLQSSPGFECAGSCARWVNGYYAVRWYDNGFQGQRYKPDADGEAKARAHFAKLVTI